MKARNDSFFAGASMAPPPTPVVPTMVWGLEMGRTGGAVEEMMVLERDI